MVDIIRIIIIISFSVIISSCSIIQFNSDSILEQDKIQLKYQEAIEYYNNEKYSKAKDLFKYIILQSMGSKIALESEFYLSESLYNLKEYEEALYGYDNYARSSQNLELIELSRFRLCQCSYNLTSDYNKDQVATIDAIEKIDFFLEDYPSSKYYLEAKSLKYELEYKLAKKEYESAVLYMKLQEYDAALIYLFEVLNNYTLIENDRISLEEATNNNYNDFLRDLRDNVRVMIIYGYLLNNKQDMAKQFYQLEIDSFYNEELKNKAESLLNEKIGKLDRWKDIYFGISK